MEKQITTTPAIMILIVPDIGITFGTLITTDGDNLEYGCSTYFNKHQKTALK
ncbi:MAG: hypothetical protein NWF00_01075 [Candidatus Bathyarchaeota archaeon]|nr:hypothetical protein [Candidatus Bathyarchaeota archaeon]